MKKQTFAIIIAVIFIAAMFIYKDSMTLSEVILAFVGMGSTIGFVWKWISEKEEKEENKKVKETFHKAMGMSVNDYEDLK